MTYIRNNRTIVTLCILLIIASALFTGCLSCLVSVSTSINNFQSLSNTSDYTFITGNDTEIDDLLSLKEFAVDYEKTNETTILSVVCNGQVNHEDILYVSTQPKKYNLLLDVENNCPLPALFPGDVALSYNNALLLGVSVGDRITITTPQHDDELTVRYLYKDPVFGSLLMSNKRIICSNEDYSLFAASPNATNAYAIYSVLTDDTVRTSSAISDITTIVFEYTTSRLSIAYIFDIIPVILAFFIGLVVLLISLGLVMFSMKATVRSESESIAMQKAIGISDITLYRTIRKRIKDMSLFSVGIGTAIGCLLSWIFSFGIRNVIVLNSFYINIIICLTSGLLLLIIIQFRCRTVLHRIKKYSPEHLSDNSPISILNHSKPEQSKTVIHRFPISVSLAVQSIREHKKKNIALFFLIMLSVATILLPVGIINTMKSEKTLRSYHYAPCDLHLVNYDRFLYLDDENTITYLFDDALKIRSNIHPTALYAECTAFLDVTSIASGKHEKTTGYFTINLLDKRQDSTGYLYDTGNAPVYPNEIAMTRISMSHLGVGLGDTVEIKFAEKTCSFIITASFSTLKAYGEGIRFSNGFVFDYAENNFLIHDIACNLNDKKDVKDAAEILSKTIPEYSCYDKEQILTLYPQGVDTSILQPMKIVIIFTVLLFSALISFMSITDVLQSDSRKIAVMKMIGISDNTIWKWLNFRAILVTLPACVCGVVFTVLLQILICYLFYGYLGAAFLYFDINIADMIVIPLLLMFSICIPFCIHALRCIRRVKAEKKL